MIYTALAQYHQVYGAYPPAYVADATGKPMHSWRVLILPWLSYSKLYNQYNFSEPWDGPNNSKLISSMPYDFDCPNHPACTPGSSLSRSTCTRYLAIVGPETAFPGGRPASVADFRGVEDKAIMIAEVSNIDIAWTEPRDLNVDRMVFRVNDPSPNAISSMDDEGPAVVSADGTRKRLDRKLSPETLKAMLKIKKE